MAYDKGTAERIAPLLKRAIEAQIVINRTTEEMAEIIAGPEYIKNVISRFILYSWGDCEPSEGFGVDQAKLLLDEIDGCF